LSVLTAESAASAIRIAFVIQVRVDVILPVGIIAIAVTCYVNAMNVSIGHALVHRIIAREPSR